VEVMQNWAKGLRTLGGFHRQRGGRLDKTGATPVLAWKRGCGQTTDVGAYANQRLNLAEEGKAHNRHAKVSNRTREIWPSGIIGGLRETRPWWNCAPTSQSEERDW